MDHRSAAIDIPGTVSDRPPDKDSPTDPGKKKRGFQPLKSIKKFFSKKKDKKEDGVTGVGIKSTSCDELETRASATPTNNGPPLGSKNLSMSADSVFNNDKIRDDGIIYKGSMSHLPQANFKDELARKLVGRRHDDGDEGLPASPPGHTTTIEAIMENGLKEKSRSMDSENSLMSMDSYEAELDENFFQSGWPGVSMSSNSDAKGTVNLDVVASTTSLNTAAAKHKIAIKPKTKRASAMMGQRRRATASPKSLTQMAPMPQVREESPPKAIVVESEEEVSIDLTESGPDTSHDLTQTTDIEELEESLSSSPPKTTTTSLSSSPPKSILTPLSTSPPKASSPLNVSSQSLSSSPTPQSETATATSAREPTTDQAEVAMKAEQTVVLRPKTVDTAKPKDSDSVVILRPDSLTSNRDVSKRQTVAIGAKDTVFGERKVKRSSLIVDDRDWDNVGKTKDKSPDEEQQGSEFASVFAKFQRNASQRKGTSPEKEVKSLDQKKAVFKSDNVASTDKSLAAPKVVNIKSGGKAGSESTEGTIKPAVSSSAQENKAMPQSEHSAKAKTIELKPAAQNSKTVVIQKSNGADLRNKNKDSIESSKRNSAEQNKRDSLEVKNRDSTQKSPRQSMEFGKKSDLIAGKQDLSNKSPRESLDISKRHSQEVNKDILSKANSDPKASLGTEPKKEDEVVTKRVNKFVSVQQKSVPLNDKSELSSGSALPKTKDVSQQPAAATKAKVVQVVEKDKTADSSMKAKDSGLGAPSDSMLANKRESPRPTNRYRSQTLPEATVGTKETGPKRANSQDNGINKENIPQNTASSTSSSSTAPPHKASPGIHTRPTAHTSQPEPQKLNTPSSTSTGGKGQPAWVSLAKKHTGSWEDKEKELESKTRKDALTDEEKGSKRASVMDLMKRFQ